MIDFKNMFRMTTWGGTKNAFLRFPLSIIASIVATLLMVVMIHEFEFADSSFIGKSLTSLIYIAVALASLKLFAERHNWAAARYALLAITTTALIIAYVWMILADGNESTYLLFAIAIGLSLIFAPFIKSDSNADSVWYFNYQTGVAIFFAGLASIILGAGLSLILKSVEYLFEIDVASVWYGDIWILCGGLLFPIYVLANISRDFDFEQSQCDFPRGVNFIANYILAPLMLAYMAILYAYFFKIIVQWQLPRGNLGWMITGFGTVGIISKLFAYPIRDRGSRLLRLFDRYYYHALIVPILLLAIAIGVRIEAYGVTEQRYAVVMLGIWFSIVAVMTIFKKSGFHIKYIPITLSALALFGSFGPWGAMDVSLRSQVNRFENLLTKHQLLTDGQLQKSSDGIPFADRKKLSSIGNYLSKTDYRLESILPMFETLTWESDDYELEASNYGGQHLMELLGLEYVGRWETVDNLETFDFEGNFDLGNRLASVSGYDYIGSAGLRSYYDNGFNHSFELLRNAQIERIEVKYKDGIFSLETGDGERLEFDILALVQRLRALETPELADSDMDRLILTQTSVNGEFSARLMLSSIDGEIKADDSVDITEILYIIMLKFND